MSPNEHEVYMEALRLEADGFIADVKITERAEDGERLYSWVTPWLVDDEGTGEWKATESHFMMFMLGVTTTRKHLEK